MVVILLEACNVSIVVLNIVNALALAADEYRCDVSQDACCASEQDGVEGAHFDVVENESECCQVEMNERHFAPGKGM